MAGAYSSAYSSAYDVGAGAGTLPAAAQKGAHGGGLIWARRQLQYLALGGPLLIPTAPVVVPDLTDVVSDLPMRRRFLRPEGLSAYTVQDFAVPAPDLAATTAPDFLLRRVLRPESPWGGPIEPPAPPPPAPDSGYSLAAEPVRGRVRPQPDPPPPILPPGYPPAEYLPTQGEVRRRPLQARQAPPYAGPEDRPVVPFDPAQQAALSPLPPPYLRLRLPLALRLDQSSSGPPGALTPVPGVVSFLPGLPTLPQRLARPRQPQLAPAQNVDPIPEQAPPEGSWQPFDTPPVRRRFARADAFAQPVDPIDTPALISSMWQGDEPRRLPRPWLRTALQQFAAEAPPIIEVLVIAGSWRGSAPDLLWQLRQWTRGGEILPPNPAVIAEGIPCIELTAVRGAYSTGLDLDGQASTLVQLRGTYSTLLNLEVC